MHDLLQVKDLRIEFQTQAGTICAVEDISFRVRAGTTVALVGESGSGKSVTAQAIMGILPRKSRITSGEILLSPDPLNPDKTTDLALLDPDSREFRSIRGNHKPGNTL